MARNHAITMNKRKEIGVLILSFLLLSCGELNKNKSFDGFSFKDLKPASLNIKGLEIEASYSGQNLVSLKYKMNRNLFREDTAIYRGNTAFLLPKGILNAKNNNEDIIRISAVILDTAKFFVFKRENSNYHLALIESSLNDSSIKIQFPWKNTIKPYCFTLTTLDSLYHYYNYTIAFKENIVLNYYYQKEWLFYRMTEVYERMQMNSENYDSLKFTYGEIYFDLNLIETEEKLLYETRRMGWSE